MKKGFGLLSISLLLFQVLRVAAVSAQQSEPKSFAQWCQHRASVPAATRRTIDVLLQEAGTKNCALADRQLRSLTELDLSINQIVDLQYYTTPSSGTWMGCDRQKLRDLLRLTSLIGKIERLNPNY
jgi:internalin A